jgi:hypothetical protein
MVDKSYSLAAYGRSVHGEKIRRQSQQLQAGADDWAGPGRMTTEEERTSHRMKLQGFKTLDKCRVFTQQHDADGSTRQGAVQQVVREPAGLACNRYQLAACTGAMK